MADDDDRSRPLGSLPGGPSRRPQGEVRAPGRPHRLTPVEEMQDRATRARQARSERQRRRRIVLGFIAAVLLAGGTGFWLGLQGHESSEDIAARQEREARERARSEGGTDTERILEEIRRLEEPDRAPGGPRTPR